MKVLIACEFTEVVKEQFLIRGHDAHSCDLLAGEKGLPNHHQCDVRGLLNEHWDLMIAHPDCTYLTVTGNKWMKSEYISRFPERARQREDAVAFFMMLANAPVEKIALENPVGIMSTRWRRPDQYIQPWQFGDRAVKKTGLWLKNLPLLVPTKIVEPEYHIYNSTTHNSGKSKYPIQWSDSSKKNWRDRVATYQGIAKAMADQWG